MNQEEFDFMFELEHPNAGLKVNCDRTKKLHSPRYLHPRLYRVLSNKTFGTKCDVMKFLKNILNVPEHLN